ncbi:MAG: DUF2236 domain-containing protein, partial [Myxococcota bacterium]|nr:DUF2236 domain-containing protein [Myxococcota bacterium]
TVTRQDLEWCLQQARAQIREPLQGIAGPGSVSWRINREAVVFLGAGRAALLQLAHPFVAHAVDEHSVTRTDVAGRFRRTFAHVYAMSFGPWERVAQAARRVHAVHEHVRGTLRETAGRFRAGDPYEANDERALGWVWGTLVDTALLVHERVMGALSRTERDAYVSEATRFAMLFGLAPGRVPQTYAAFRRWFDDFAAGDEIAVTACARRMADFLLTAPSLALRPAAAVLRLVTAGTLPPRLREGYGLSFGPAERAAFAALWPALRATYPRLPARLRHVPAYVEAMRRVRGLPARDPFGRAVERALVGLLERANRTPSVGAPA